MLRKVPLIVILGSTGTGKTKLSIELAERFGGEIISADSMQVYANLDVVTAKATQEERARVKHHLLDVATPTEPYTVVNFRNAALPIIENLLAESKCPIVVGGTNYYIESLLWDVLVSPPPTTETGRGREPDEGADPPDLIAPSAMNVLTPTEMLESSSEELHGHLMKIDPTTANRIHPNNKRKIQRAIEVYQQTGQPLSLKLRQQRQQPGGNRLGGPLRYPHTILFWLRCQQDVLNARLDKRVDGMLEQGLLQEVRDFHNHHNPSTSSSNLAFTKGVLQTIGFKEFIPYLERFDAANDQKIQEYLQLRAYKMPTEDQLKANEMHESSLNDRSASQSSSPLPPGLDVLATCLDRLKLVTQRYSKKQIKWINNRFLASKDRQVPDLYELDTSDVAVWHEEVYQRAVTIVDCYRNGQTCEIQPMVKLQHPGAGLDEETSHFCPICERHFIGEFQWRLHLQSNKHKRRKEGRKKNEKLWTSGREQSGDSKPSQTATEMASTATLKTERKENHDEP